MSDNEFQKIEQLLLNRPRSIEQLIDGIGSDVVDSLRLAVEIGKWGDGKRLDPGQLDLCMQAIILYEAKHLPEQERVVFDLSANCESKTTVPQTQAISVSENNGSMGAKGN